MSPSLLTPKSTALPQPPSLLLHNLLELSHTIPELSHEICGDIAELNIIERLCTQKLSQCKEDYIAALSILPEQLHAFHEVYIVGALHQDP